jgi:hypothetical protein
MTEVGRIAIDPSTLGRMPACELSFAETAVPTAGGASMNPAMKTTRRPAMTTKVKQCGQKKSGQRFKIAQERVDQFKSHSVRQTQENCSG